MVYRSAILAGGLAVAAAAVVLLLIAFRDPWDVGVVLALLVLPTLIGASALVTPLESRRVMVRSAVGVALVSAMVLLFVVFDLVHVNWLMLVASAFSAGLVAVLYADADGRPWTVRSVGASVALVSSAVAGYFIWRLSGFT